MKHEAKRTKLTSTAPVQKLYARNQCLTNYLMFLQKMCLELYVRKNIMMVITAHDRSYCVRSLGDKFSCDFFNAFITS